MTRDEMLDKVEKLLALSTSENEHEAASAAAHAAAIMERHAIEMADLGPLGDGVGEALEESTFDPMGKRLVQWRARLALVVAEANGCSVYSRRLADGLRNTQIVGSKQDVGKARLLFDFCVAEIARLTLQNATGRGRAFANAYRHGCVEAIGAAIKAESARIRADATARGSSCALVVADRAQAANEFIRDRHPMGRASRAHVSSRRGLAEGKRDGERIYRGRHRVDGSTEGESFSRRLGSEAPDSGAHEPVRSGD